MNRLEWFNNQTDEVKSKFEYNCVNNNHSPNFFAWWLNKRHDRFQEGLIGGKDVGISGAFSWSNTSEGFDYWHALNKKITK